MARVGTFLQSPRDSGDPVRFGFQSIGASGAWEDCWMWTLSIIAFEATLAAGDLSETFQ